MLGEAQDAMNRDSQPWFVEGGRAAWYQWPVRKHLLGSAPTSGPPCAFTSHTSKSWGVPFSWTIMEWLNSYSDNPTSTLVTGSFPPRSFYVSHAIQVEWPIANPCPQISCHTRTSFPNSSCGVFSPSTLQFSPDQWPFRLLHAVFSNHICVCGFSTV